MAKRKRPLVRMIGTGLSTIIRVIRDATHPTPAVVFDRAWIGIAAQ